MGPHAGNYHDQASSRLCSSHINTIAPQITRPCRYHCRNGFSNGAVILTMNCDIGL